MQVPTREMEIEDRVFELHVAEQQLDGAQVGAGLQQMCRVRVAEDVRGHVLVKLRAGRGTLTGIPDDFRRDRFAAASPSRSRS